MVKSRRALKKAVQQGRSRRKHGGVAPGYVEDAFEARTALAGFFSALLERKGHDGRPSLRM
jgi:hypothetical protein